MSKARKLLTPSTLEKLAELTAIGVPVASAMRQLDLEGKITRPTVVALLKIYRARFDYDVHGDLFPGWMNVTGDAVQEQPEGWDYVGYFPSGHWEDKGSDACKA